MELDTLKELWVKSSKSGSFLNPEDIQNMLRNENQGALNKLIRLEKTFIFIAILIIPFFWATLYMHSLIKNEFSTGLVWLGIVFTAYVVYTFFMQCYKYKYLKSINMMSMNIIAVSKLITKYKKIVVYDLVVGFCWAIPFVCFLILVMLGKNESVGVYIFFAIYTILLFIVAIMLHRKYYFKRILSIQQTLKEIKEFQKDE